MHRGQSVVDAMVERSSAEYTQDWSVSCVEVDGKLAAAEAKGERDRTEEVLSAKRSPGAKQNR